MLEFVFVLCWMQLLTPPLLDNILSPQLDSSYVGPCSGFLEFFPDLVTVHDILVLVSALSAGTFKDVFGRFARCHGAKVV